MKSVIMHIDRLDKGIPAERRGRKTSDLRDTWSYDSGATEVTIDHRLTITTRRQHWQPGHECDGFVCASTNEHTHPGRS